MAKTRLQREAKTLQLMVSLYCRKKHGSRIFLCKDCQALLDFSLQRVKYCPYGENKPICSKCKIHCYIPMMRERIKKVMRYAGPRMLLHHPLLAIQHLLDGNEK